MWIVLNQINRINQSKVHSILSDLMHSRYWVQRRQWHLTPVLLPGKSHGQRSLEGCSPWGRWGSDTTERLHFHFSLSCSGEGNGNPLQCSCLENPRDGEAWWAAICGVAQSQIRLKRFSSSSSSKYWVKEKSEIPIVIVYTHDFSFYHTSPLRLMNTVRGHLLLT